MNNTSLLKKQFFNSIKRGTGEAYLIARKNPSIDFSAYILKGAINNYGYDRQAEGSRADYIYQFIKRDPNKQKIINAVLRKLQEEKENYYKLDQMCDLAVHFYKDGFVEAKEALYKRLGKNNLSDYEFCDVEQLAKIDGLEGLLKIAESIGIRLSKNKDDYETSYFVDSFQQKHKSIRVWKELEKAAKKNEYINLYLTSILENKVPQTKRSRVRFSYQLLKEKIDAGTFIHIPSKALRDIPKKDIKRLAKEFLEEKDLQRKKSYLRVFDYLKFPFDYTPILQLATKPPGKNPRFVEFCCGALKFFSGEDIRKLALDKLSAKKDPSDYLELLINNYKKGDHILLTKILERSNSYDFIHANVYGLIDIYRANSTPACKKPLELVYNKMNCGLHRIDIIRILDDNKVLSKKIFQELEFDSSLDVRLFYRKKVNRIK